MCHIASFDPLSSEPDKPHSASAYTRGPNKVKKNHQTAINVFYDQGRKLINKPLGLQYPDEISSATFCMLL